MCWHAWSRQCFVEQRLSSWASWVSQRLYCEFKGPPVCLKRENRPRIDNSSEGCTFTVTSGLRKAAREMGIRGQAACEVFCNARVGSDGWRLRSCSMSVTQIHLNIKCTMFTYWLFLKIKSQVYPRCAGKCCSNAGCVRVTGNSSLFVGVLNGRNCPFTPLEEESSHKAWATAGFDDLITKVPCD